MSELVDTLIDSLLEREADVGSTITWAGSDYPCSGGAELGGKTLSEGGFRLSSQVPIVLRTAVFSDQNTRPREKQILIYKSSPTALAKTLRIDAATLLYDSILVLDCNDPSQKL